VKVTPLRLPARAYGKERKAYRQLFGSIRPDLMHSHGYRSDVLAGPMAGRLGIPRISTVHGFTGGDWKNRIYEYLQVRAWRRYDKVVAVSAPLERWLRSAGLRSDQVALVPNAYASVPVLSRAEARRALGLDDSEVVLGWIGRLSREKGLDVLLDAMPGLPDLRLSVLGEGRERASLQVQAGRLGIAGRIRWHGMVPQAAALYCAFDVFVLSSRTEGTPISLFEAMAAGVPVVATRVGGVPDVITESEARLVPSESPHALAEAIEATLGQVEETRRRTAGAERRLEQHFAVGPWLDRYEALYRGLAS
jgi:glycosyltransferase involved in cell wall biosynthesis